MKKACLSSQWYDSEFYVNIDKTHWIRNTRELLIECVDCQQLLDCKKREIFYTLLQENEKMCDPTDQE